MMRVMSLSDHPAAMLRDAQQQRAAVDRDARQAYQEALTVHRDRVAQARAVRDQARAQRRWGAWLHSIFAVWRAGRQAPAVPLPASQPTEEEASWAAGTAGELLVADQLGRALDDEWTLLRGYRNRGGEIDHLLLGPRGLFALEVKNQNARIDCHGDEWWATKYDKYGNQVEPRREMTDRRGRSPSVQLNEPSTQLEGFLASRGHPVGIGRIVVLIHESAQLRSCIDPTVHICTSVRQILHLLNGSSVTITPAERAELERLIVRDHRFHAQRRSR